MTKLANKPFQSLPGNGLGAGIFPAVLLVVVLSVPLIDYLTRFAIPGEQANTVDDFLFFYFPFFILSILLSGLFVYLQIRSMSVRLKEVTKDLQWITELFSYTEDIVYRTDEKGVVLWIAPSVEKTFGYRVEEATGMNMGTIYADHGRMEFLEAMVAGGGKVYNYEAPMLHKNGTVRWVSTNAHFIYSRSGEITGVQGVSRIIDSKKKMEQDLRRSEEIFRSFADHSIVGILHYNREGIISYSNQAACAMLGYGERELQRMTVWDVLDPSYLDVMRASFKKRLEGDRQVRRFQNIRVIDRLGNIRNLYVVTSRIESDLEFLGSISMLDKRMLQNLGFTVYDQIDFAEDLALTEPGFAYQDKKGQAAWERLLIDMENGDYKSPGRENWTSAKWHINEIRSTCNSFPDQTTLEVFGPEQYLDRTILMDSSIFRVGFSILLRDLLSAGVTHIKIAVSLDTQYLQIKINCERSPNIKHESFDTLTVFHGSDRSLYLLQDLMQLESGVFQYQHFTDGSILLLAFLPVGE